jgi:enhancing lycopene biosynthesis protein 2
MNEIEFIVRRIIKEGEEWTLKRYEESKDKQGGRLYYFNQHKARIELLNHLVNQFLTEEKNVQN